MTPEDRDLLARALWDCLLLSGADVSGYDGFEHWKRMRAEGMATEAVDGVRRLREDYDEACEEVSLSPAEPVRDDGRSPDAVFAMECAGYMTDEAEPEPVGITDEMVQEAQAAYVDVLCNLGERDSTAMRAALEAAWSEACTEGGESQ